MIKKGTHVFTGDSFSTKNFLTLADADCRTRRTCWR